MGHADEQMVLKIYAHLTEKKKRESALALAKVVIKGDRSQKCSQANTEVSKIVDFSV